MSSWLAFGDLHVDLDSGLMIRGAERTQLRPRHLQVLRVLVERRGSIVTRDDLLEQVWTGRFVTDDVVRRAIAGLRRDLGDSADQPTCIETVPRRGYRWLPEGIPVDPDSVDAEDAPRPTESEEPAEPTPDVEAGPGTGPTRHRSKKAWVVALGAAVLTTLLWQIGPFLDEDEPSSEPDVASEVAPITRLLIGDWEGGGEVPIELASLLPIALRQVEGVDVASESEVRIGLALMRSPSSDVESSGQTSASRIDRARGRELCRRLNVDVLVVPSVATVGETVFFELEMVEAHSGASRGKHAGQFAGMDEMGRALDGAAAWIRARVGSRAASVAPSVGALEQATTKSLAALIAYSRALDAQARGQVREGEALLALALEEDPSFPLARLALAQSLRMTGAPPEEVAQHLELLDLDGLPSRERRYAEAWMATMGGDRDAAFAAWTLFRDLYPKESFGYMNLAAMRRFDELDFVGCVEELDRLEQAHPGIVDADPVAGWMWTACAVAAGRDGEKALRRIRRLAEPEVLPTRGLHALLSTRRLSDAEQLMETATAPEHRPMLLHPPTVYRMLLAAQESRLDAYDADLESLVRDVSDSGQNARWGGVMLQLSVVPLVAATGRDDLLASLSQEALGATRRLAEAAVDSDESMLAPYALVTILATCRQGPLTDCLDESVLLARSLPALQPRTAADSALREILAAEVAWAEGDRALAGERFRVSITYADSVRARFALLELAEEIGDHAAAARHQNWLRDRFGRTFYECFSPLVCFDRVANILEHLARFPEAPSRLPDGTRP